MSKIKQTSFILEGCYVDYYFGDSVCYNIPRCILLSYCLWMPALPLTVYWWYNQSSPSPPFHFLASASSERWVLLPGEIWREPSQHVSFSEVQLVRRLEEERPAQSRTRHPPGSEGRFFPAKACRQHVKPNVSRHCIFAKMFKCTLLV